MKEDRNTNIELATSALRGRVEREPDPADEMPYESETLALARHRDPSLVTPLTEPEAAKTMRPTVEWVRPTDLMASRSARMAGRGIDFLAELGSRARLVPGRAYQATTIGARSGVRFERRARRLPPVTAFGRGGGERSSRVSRSGIGLG